mgnify:CR=1 FL=1
MLTEEFNKRNLDVQDGLGASDIVIHSHTSQLRGLENFKKILNMFIKGFPDYHDTVEDIIAEGDKIATRWTMTGVDRRYLRASPLKAGR